MKKLYTIVLLFLVSISSYSQTVPYTINQNHNSCCGGGAETGSSFKVFGAGQIDSIKIFPRHNEDYTSTIKFYKGNGPTPDSLLYTQSFSVTGVYHHPAGNEEKIIRLTSPVVVKKDSVYTFYIKGTPIRYSPSEAYANGSYWDAAGENKSKDVDFIVYVGNITTTSVSSETLSSDILVQMDNSQRALSVKTENKNFQLKLYNTNGILVSEGANNRMNLPVLPEAIYILQLSTENELYSKKLYIKQ